jgi:hypothetical protein
METLILNPTNTVVKVKKPRAKRIYKPRVKKEKVLALPDKIIINKYNGKGGLAEIYQSMVVKLALLKKTDTLGVFDQICPFVQCYDFLCDAYTATKEKIKFGIYGFSWDGTTKEPEYDGVYLIIKFPNTVAEADFNKNIHFLHDIEDKNKIERTKFVKTDDLTGFIKGSKDWLNNCIKLRLYLFFFRAFSYPLKTDDWVTELGGQEYSDSSYIKNLNRESWDRILNDLTSIHTDFWCGLEMKNKVGAVHHNSGFFSVFSKHSEMSPKTVRENKHWITMKDRGFKLFTQPE